MNRSIKFRIGLAVLLTTICVVASYEVKDLIFPTGAAGGLLAIVISLFFGNYAAETFVSYLFRIRSIRKLVFGTAWIEGCWHIQTFKYTNKNQVLLSNALLQLEYEYERSFTITGFGYYRRGNLSSTETYSHSVEIVLRESDRLYINYLLTGTDNVQRTGVAIGRFFVNHPMRFPTFYEGKLVYFHDNSVDSTLRQVGRKMPDSEILRLIAEHGDAWKDCYLSAQDQSDAGGPQQLLLPPKNLTPPPPTSASNAS